MRDLRDVQLLPAASRIGTTVDALGESPVWDDREQCVYYLDIIGRRVYRVEGAAPFERSLVYETDRSVTCVLPAEDGGLLIVERDRLVTRSPAGEVRRGESLLSDPRRRFNDGICDSQGRLLVGTLHEGDVANEEVLMRIDASGQVETILTALTLSNGLGFDRTGTRMYHVDTLRSTVTVYDYGAPVPIALQSFRVEPGYPDGLTVDAEGFFWVAVWGGAEVRRFSPDGALEARLPLPARQVTAPVFGGTNLDQMFITTAAEGLDAPHLADGGLFRAEVGVHGIAGYRWAGSTRG